MTGIAFSGHQNDEKLHIGSTKVSRTLKNLIVRPRIGRTEALWMLDSCGSRVLRHLKNINFRPPKCRTETQLLLGVEGLIPLEESFSQRNK
jgi:hypothetical protein